MSLRVWLPLTGDFHNQGLENITITNYGSVFDTAGKIANSCCSFDGVDDYFQFSNLDLNGLEELSISFWVYSTTGTLSSLFLVRNSSTQHQVRISGDGFTFRDKAHSSQQNMPFEQPVINTWTHYVVIYDNGSTRAYKNGIQIAEKIYSNISSLNTSLADMRVGRVQSSTGNTYFTGKINDFRIYDHALSDKEIKEISKGLVLHWELKGNGFENKNLFKNSSLSDLTSSNLNSKIRYVSTYPPEITNDGVKFTWSGSNARELGLWLDENLKVDTDYTLSFIYKSNMQIGTSFFLRNGNTLVGYWSQTTIPQSTDWTCYTCTFKPISYQSGDITKGNSLTLFYSGYTANKWIELKQNSIKLEEGTQVTSWCPANSDDISLNIPNNIIYDSSGYNHNGTIVGTATLDFTSSRYNIATHMNNNSSANRIEADPVVLPIDEITVSFWAYTTKENSYVLYIDQNMSFAVNAAGTGFWVSRVNSKGFPIDDFILGQWNHVVLVRQNSDYKAYINGVEISRSMGNNVWTHSNGRLYLLNRNYNNSYAANASISDFRMYATALSAEDILELYHTGQSIDKDGNLYAYDFYEDDASNISLKKNGVITAKEFDNQDNLTSFYKTGEIYTNELKEI